MLKIALACLATVVLTTPAAADSFTFTTVPSGGNISGPAGSTIGWGYTIANLSPNWLVTDNLSAGLFLHGTPNALIFDFPVIAPGASLFVGFDSTNMKGLYGLKWDGNAPNGFTNYEVFILDRGVLERKSFRGGQLSQCRVRPIRAVCCQCNCR